MRPWAVTGPRPCTIGPLMVPMPYEPWQLCIDLGLRLNWAEQMWPQVAKTEMRIGAIRVGGHKYYILWPVSSRRPQDIVKGEMEWI